MASNNINTRRPSAFLSLAPDVSDSYPRFQNTSHTLEATATGAASRRSSDSSTSGSGSANRVLKLGPVHWGEHTDDHKDDFHTVTPEEAK